MTRRPAAVLEVNSCDKRTAAAAAAEELSATRQLWDAAAAPADRPLIIFNGELDRLRGGYYPGGLHNQHASQCVMTHHQPTNIVAI
jgi:hypothetical protein